MKTLPPAYGSAPGATTMDAPVLSYDARSCEWVLREPYAYEHDGTRIDVPAGFRFDLASVPRLAWWLVAPFELSISASLLHDYLYRYGGATRVGGRTYRRAEADALFREVMRREGVPGWQWASAYAAVRLFGWTAWRPSASRHRSTALREGFRRRFGYSLPRVA